LQLPFIAFIELRVWPHFTALHDFPGTSVALEIVQRVN
jgi:hypothetical protein